jgi:hypothetical protein
VFITVFFLPLPDKKTTVDMKNLWIVFLSLSLFSYAQWTDNAGINTIINSYPGSKYVPKVVVTPEGNYFFSWYGGSGNLDMNLAYFDHDGFEIWPNGALKVSTHPQNSWVDDYFLAADSEGNALVVFSDIRDGTKSVVVYKIDAEGNHVWGEDGIFFSLLNSDEFQPKVSVAPDNSVYVFFSTNYTNGNDNEIVIHRVEEDGALSWGADGQSFNEDFGANWVLPSGQANEDNSITIGFFRETGNFPATVRWIKSFRCNSDGSMMGSVSTITNAGGISAWTDLSMYANRDGSAHFVWHDDRFNNNTYEVYAQAIDADGNTLWNENGVLLGMEANGHQLYELPAGLNQNNEFIVFWNRLNTNQSAASLVYQRIDPTGELLETNTGKTILPMSDQLQNGIEALQFGDTSFYLYNYFLSGSSYLTSYNMLALDSSGEMIWPAPVEMVNSSIDRTHPAMSEFSSNQAVVCWSDEMLDNNRVMAQNIFTDGALGSSTVSIEDVSQKKYTHFVRFIASTHSLEMNNLQKGDRLHIFNLLGQEVYNESAAESFYLNPYIKGAYVAVLMRNGHQLENFKFLIQ